MAELGTVDPKQSAYVVELRQANRLSQLQAPHVFGHSAVLIDGLVQTSGALLQYVCDGHVKFVVESNAPVIHCNRKWLW